MSEESSMQPPIGVDKYPITFKLINSSQLLPSDEGYVAPVKGQILFVKDTGEFYLDHGSGEAFRQHYGAPRSKLMDDVTRMQITLSGAVGTGFYYVGNSKKFWYFDKDARITPVTEENWTSGWTELQTGPKEPELVFTSNKDDLTDLSSTKLYVEGSKIYRYDSSEGFVELGKDSGQEAILNWLDMSGEILI